MRIRSILLIPFASAAIYACSSAEPEPLEDGLPAGYEDVLLEAKVTDETLTAFVEALEKGPPADIPAQKAKIDWPADGEKLPRNPVVSFCWSFGATASRPGPALDTRWAGLQPFTESPPADLTRPLRDLLGPPRPAFAHGDPYSGAATYLVFSTDTDPKLLRVFTGDTKFIPSQAVWDRMAAVGKPITLKLVSAFFEQDRIPTGESPVAGPTMQFTISL